MNFKPYAKPSSYFQRASRFAASRLKPYSRRSRAIAFMWASLWSLGYISRRGKFVTAILIVLVAMWATAIFSPVGSPVVRGGELVASVAFSVKYDAIQTVTVGSDPTATAPDPTQVGSGLGATCTAIANWTNVSYDAFSGLFNVGIPAFHMNEISHVDVRSNGAATWTTLTDMDINPQSGVIEFTGQLDAANYSAGVVKVEAIAVPFVGMPRLLDPLYLIPQPTGGSGEFYPVYAYVNASTGNDGTGAASPSSVTASGSPFATIGAAAHSIQTYRNGTFGKNNVDRGIVRLSPEAHVWNAANLNALMPVVNGWLTIEAEPGHGPADTSIDYDPVGHGVIRCDMERLRNIRINQTQGANGGYIDSAADEGYLWIDRCVVVGAGRTLSSSTPYRGTWAGIYYTDNDISQCGTGVPVMDRAAMVRGNNVHAVGGDFVRNCHVVVHNIVDDLFGEVDGEHTDFYQLAGGVGDNLILYDNVATNLKYQSFYCAFDNGVVIPTVANGAHGVAWISNSINAGNTTDPTLSDASWQKFADHFLIWDCVFNDRQFLFYQDAANAIGYPPTITNFSVRNNYWYHLKMAPGQCDDIDTSLWDSNRFHIIAGDPGSDGSTSPLIGTNATHV
jgi:hypothetical protein